MDFVAFSAALGHRGKLTISETPELALRACLVVAALSRSVAFDFELVSACLAGAVVASFFSSSEPAHPLLLDVKQEKMGACASSETVAWWVTSTVLVDSCSSVGRGCCCKRAGVL
jgi:hypothetical protein